MAATKAQLFSYLDLPQVKAALDTIAWAEGGTYNKLYGGGTFNDFSKHPCRAISAGAYTSTAAGRYQFLCSTWNGIARRYGLADFSPRNQDFGALVEAMDKGGLNSIVAGNFEQAMRDLGAGGRCAWAALPYSSCGQRMRGVAETMRYYNGALRVYQGQGGTATPIPTQPNTPVSAQPNAPAPPQNDDTLIWTIGGLVLLGLLL